MIAVQSSENVKLRLLLDLSEMTHSEVELSPLLDLFEKRVALALDADRASLWLLDGDTGRLRTRVANLPELDELTLAPGRGVAGMVATTGQGVVIDRVDTCDRWAGEFDEMTGYRTESIVCEPVRSPHGIVGVIQVINKIGGTFSEQDRSYLGVLADQIGRALQQTSLRSRSGRRGLSLRSRFNHVVGDSQPMEAAYDKVMRAAGTDATVLLRGETGTGKGLLARAIHVNSQRAAGPFVHIDTSAIPPTLIESELFGCEQGAYTGADRQRAGKVERARGGTLFLDEIDSLSPALQAKLLRFLQERCFERVGGRETLTVDVRIVVATNADLAELVNGGQFRSDLYYRIRVIDIELPALRERGRGDILALAEHFLGVFCDRYRRGSLHFSERAREALCAHPWPGNVRELEHAVERAVVLADGAELTGESLGLGDARGPRVRMLPDGAVPLEPGLSLDEAIGRYARACLERHGGNQSAASRDLCIGRNRLARLLKKSAD